ncbi:hypothetical protein CkaCkLH20_08514 [Colletotrichum karsti]|uniref:Protein FAF1 n=1 Tax=Colletotrichum karsti TaxID=1095194 RepID=A0A9P6LJ08_9PEZI|nr:uncharacterized protein CkaCkLH20_08514 [Colletotrichum karsti]KAF9874142.1 hypothetical protein CkaCkLH20_08514 [Colletotrichum karsti]
MASVLGKRKAPSGAASLGKRPSTAAAATTTKKMKKGVVGKSAMTKKPAAAAAKEPEQEEEDEEKDEAITDAREIFRRHFEAAFKPLPETTSESGAPKGKKNKAKKAKAKAEVVEEEDEDEEDLDEDVGADGEEEGEDEDEDEWDGLSGDEDASVSDDASEEEEEEEEEENVVQVVDHSSSAPKVASMSKRELKAFMSSKPPSQTSSTPTALPSTSTPEDDENDKSNLANDLALQRLLSESHLLARHSLASPFSNPSGTASKTFSDGRLRARQTDLRTQALAPGVKSLFKQESMPMAIRKGMNAAAAGREGKRRRQARENGVVLEREAPKKTKKSGAGGRGERSVDGPAVGRMKGAELRLSERDIRSIEGSGGGSGGRGGGRGGRGGGRGGRR